MKLDCFFSVLDFLFGPVFLFSEELELTGVELDLGLFISLSTLVNTAAGLELAFVLSICLELLRLIGVLHVEIELVFSGLLGVSCFDRLLKTVFLHAQVPAP